MEYIEGFLLAVPNKNKQAYIQQAVDMAQLFKDHGATRLIECWGDDVPDGQLTSFPLAVKCQDDESVVFSWIVWPSKELRDSGMEKVMSDPRMAKESNLDLFDGKRMVFGGFQMVVNE